MYYIVLSGITLIGYISERLVSQLQPLLLRTKIVFKFFPIFNSFVHVKKGRRIRCRCCCCCDVEIYSRKGWRGDLSEGSGHRCWSKGSGLHV